MKYILRYEIKSKYLGFKKIGYKDFDNTFDIFVFIANNPLCEWKIYQEKEIEYSELLREGK